MKEYSAGDGVWYSLREGLPILRSKYVLVITAITEVIWEIDATRYVVAVGASSGKTLSQYLHARVDKACAVKVDRVKAKVALTK